MYRKTESSSASRARASRPWIAATAALAIAGLATGTVLTRGATAATGQGATTGAQSPIQVPRAQTPRSFADIVDAVIPAVVEITIERGVEPAALGPQLPPALRHHFPRHPFGPGHRGHPGAHGVGSGFLISADGLVVTNDHVVRGARRIEVTLGDGRKLEATVKGRDPVTDLAVLSIESDTALPHLALGDSDRTRVGDWVVTVGTPFGLGGTVTAGIVSARGRNIGSGPYDDYLQIDAPINRGNSGGPLLDGEGRVVGINTAIFSPSGGNVGIGFAIPANSARTIIDALVEDGRIERAWLGVELRTVSAADATELGLEPAAGALIATVRGDSPARAAGLRAGDVIVAIGDTAVIDAAGAARVVAGRKEGERTAITVWRDGRRDEVSVALGKRPEPGVDG